MGISNLLLVQRGPTPRFVETRGPESGVTFDPQKWSHVTPKSGVRGDPILATAPRWGNWCSAASAHLCRWLTGLSCGRGAVMGDFAAPYGWGRGAGGLAGWFSQGM